MSAARNWEVFWNIGDTEYESVHEEAMSVIHEHTADLVLYTDGSATHSVKNGGAAVVVTRSDLAGWQS